ncbi:alpha/beta fold hydrolase [Microbacterium sp. P04]|uniref:alpha/beta fold hydrolase n=1 Tax=Microbacterium sp. P04 TaxID=3366947 RepID=UPI003745ACA8
MTTSTSQTFEPDGRAIPFSEEGEGPLVVLLPARGLSIASLGTLSHVLEEEGFRILRVGYRRPVADAALTMHDLAQDVVDLLTELNVSTTWVGGHAFGGAVARTVALDHPDRVEGLVLLGVEGAEPVDETAARALQSALSDVDETASDEVIRLVAGPSVDPGFARRALSRNRDLAVEPMLSAALAATPVAEWSPLAPRIPVAIIQGSDDAIAVPANGERLRASAPERASLATIAGGGYLFVLTHPGEIGAEIEDYLGWD